MSNWACYALGLALFALRSCTFHERYVRKAVGFPLDPNSFMLDWLPSVSRVSFRFDVFYEVVLEFEASAKIKLAAMLFRKHETPKRHVGSYLSFEKQASTCAAHFASRHTFYFAFVCAFVQYLRIISTVFLAVHQALLLSHFLCTVLAKSARLVLFI